MPELNNQLREIYLEPGELLIAREPAIILTALGACIGITFWSAKLRAGALAHPLLRPDGFDCRKAPGHLTALRGFSIRQLAWQFDQLDVSRREVHVKVFGGAEVVGSERPQSRRSAN